jgi:hypothetical protein
MTEKEKEYFRQYHLKNKERKCAMAKQWRLDHPEQYKLTKQQYVEQHKEEKAEKDKEYYEANKEKLKEYKRQWCIKNKERLREKRKAYKKNNPEIIKRLAKKYVSQARIKIARNLRNRLWYAVAKGHKSASTLELLGCSIDCLMQHLEASFTEGMSFENYGEWHIDHIIPCASFDLTDYEQQKLCFHYTNLQPLWAVDNIRKSDTMPI